MRIVCCCLFFIIFATISSIAADFPVVVEPQEKKIEPNSRREEIRKIQDEYDQKIDQLKAQIQTLKAERKQRIQALSNSSKRKTEAPRSTDPNFSGIIENEIIRAKLRVGSCKKQQTPAGEITVLYQDATTPNQMDKENSTILFSVENKTNRELKNVKLVLYPPQKGKAIVKSLEYIEGNGKHGQHTVLNCPSISTSEGRENRSALIAEFQPIYNEDNVLFIAEVFEGETHVGRCAIQVSVSAR